MNFAIKTLGEKLADELVTKKLCEKHLKSTDKYAQLWAEGNINPCLHRIEEIEKYIFFLNTVKNSVLGEEITLIISDKSVKVLKIEN